MTGPISIPAPKLREMLSAVLPHAGTDDTLPALAAVLFEVCDGVLYLVATDRYTMGVARERIPGAQSAPMADQSALLSCENAEHMLALLSASTEGVAAIIIRPREIIIETGGGPHSWPMEDYEYPDWRAALHAMLTAETGELGDGFGVNPALLTRFALDPAPFDPWQSKPLRLRIAPRSSSPALLVTYGDWFLGALMAVRCAKPDDRGAYDGVTEPQWAAWASATAVPETAGATA